MEFIISDPEDREIGVLNHFMNKLLRGRAESQSIIWKLFISGPEVRGIDNDDVLVMLDQLRYFPER